MAQTNSSMKKFRSEDLKYKFLQGFHQMMLCVVQAYCTYYLLESGFRAYQVGLITALAGISAIILQPVIGRVADSARGLNWKQLIMLIALICDAALLLVFFGRTHALVGASYGVCIAAVNCMFPLINAASFYYVSHGIKVDFGVARGIGSLTYALLSLALGQLTLLYGKAAVPVSGLVAMTALLVTTSLFPIYADDAPVKAAPKKQERRSGGLLAFFRRYPAFFIMVLACLFAMSFHNMYSYYLINLTERAGGNSGTLGAVCFVAAVTELPVMFTISKIVKKIRPAVLLVIACFAYALKGLCFLAATNVPALFATQFMQIVTFALLASTAVYYTEEQVDAADRNTGQAFMSYMHAGGTVIGSALAGFLIDQRGLSFMLLVGIGVALLSGILASAALILGKKRLQTQ